MNLQGSAARESLGLLGISCLCGAGFFLVAHFKQQAPIPAVTIEPKAIATPTQSPVHSPSPWATDVNRWTGARVSLSPKGTFLAGICPGRVDKPETSNSTRSRLAIVDLVIWRVHDRQEVARAALGHASPASVKWSDDESLIATEGLYGQVFRMPTGASQESGLPATLELVPFLGTRTPDVVQTCDDLNRGIRVQSMRNAKLRAWHLMSGTSIPLRLPTDPDARWYMLSGGMTLQPGNSLLSLRAAFLQREPTFVKVSAQQQAFLRRENIANEEVSAIVGKLQGDEELPQSEILRLETRAKRLNAQMKAERDRLSPRIPMPTPNQWMRLTLCDLRTGRQLWQKRLPITLSTFMTRVLWSPDGKIIMVMGTGRPSKRIKGRGDDCGVDVFDSATGTRLASTQLSNRMLWRPDQQVQWLQGQTLVTFDYDVLHNPLLHLLDARTGQKKSTWRLGTEIFGDVAVSASSDGSKWAFASGMHGWSVLSREQIEHARNSGTAIIPWASNR